MKHQNATLFLILGLGQAALGGNTPLPAYANYGVVTQAPVIDSPSFYNAGDFEIDAVTSINLTNLNNIFGNGYSVLPFMTKDTLYFTNTGLMTGYPGFRFDTGTSTSRHSASFFLNQGTLMGLDTEAFLYLYSTPGSKTAVPIPADSQPIASQLLILATNIVNTGNISVGNAGLLSMVGKNVTNSFASLAAGAVSTVGTFAETNDITGLQGEDDVAFDGSGRSVSIPSPGVYDLYWGVTNGDTVNIEALSGDLPAGLPGIITGERGFNVPIFFGGNANAQYSVSATLYAIGTNIYYNIVFINTNFADPNLSVALGVLPGGEFLQFTPESSIPPANFGALENIVQISEPVYDVITGQTVTNGIYIIDDGGILPSMTLALNGSEPGSTEPEGFSRPNPFELTTVTPPQWSEAFLEAQDFYPSSPGYEPELIYEDGIFNNNMEAVESSVYGAQIGHNPSDIYGSFAPLIDATANSFLGLELLDEVNLPDPTNEPGRIEITGNNVDLTQTRLRAEGMFVLNATNLLGVGTTAQDWGEANVNLGAANGALTLSNVFPTTFQRVRGDIYLRSATWQNSQTNQFGSTNAATNQWYYHVLVVDQNIFGSFPSTVRSLKLAGTNSIVLQDNLNVINQAVISTPNLTITSTNFFSQNAQNVTPATLPGLKNLFIGPDGVLGASSILDIGLNQSQGQGSPIGRKYAVNSIVNFGQMIATAPLLQSAYIQNAGEITSDNGGSMVIAANELSLGPALSNLTNYIDSQTNELGLTVTNSTNYLTAYGSINLSAASIVASHSIIDAGLGGTGGLTLDVTAQLTDFVSGTPTTNTNSVIINHWSTTGGFSLPLKPAIGDLFGTELHTMSSSNQQAVHVWGATDLGATTAGFVNNAVIGRLVLDRQAASAVLRFSAAGAKNAMYVDYLELTNFAFSGYRSNLLIDPNFKIYFADCNADPQKLMEVYPGLVWVPSFAGPNSTQVVPYFDSSNICLMNAALAQSTEISFFNGVANFYNQPYVLNNPSDPTQTYPCPGDETTVQSLLVTSLAAGGGNTLNLMNITVNGEGSISPGLKASQLAVGKSYTLTATPAKGWVFQDWSTIGLPASVNDNSRVLSFTFVSNTVITANFIRNPFALVQGSYNGLFFENNVVNPGSSGAFSLTLANTGAFSGRLLMGPSAYNFSSQFSGAGEAQVLAKSGAHSLTVNLQLDMTGQTGQILGDVNGGTWDAPLTANVAPVWTAEISSPLAGSYTLVLPWQSGIIGAPGGDSYAVGTVSKQGVLSMAGALADGTAFSASAPVSQGGLWPFYVYAASGKDTLLGWVSVGNGLNGTNISWSKAPGKAALYTGGFNNILQLEGSPWQTPAKDSAALTLNNPTVILSGGNLAEPLTGSVTLQNFLTYAGTDLSLSIRPGNGSFSGWFIAPGATSKQAISGVVLQNQGRARGFFPGTNASGSVLLEGQ